MKYKKRISDTLLIRKLQGKGAVLIEGPKWCGKTTSASQHSGSVLNLGDSEILKQSRQIAEINTKVLLQGQTPRLIDEWQVLPELWDSVRSEVDRRGEFGQFILTGSSVPPDANQFVHSGTGRISRLRMRTMSLYESGESKGTVSLETLFQNQDIEITSNELDLEQIAYLLCRGGWPQATVHKGSIALDQAFDYYDAVVNTDIHRIDSIRRSTERTKMILRSYTRNLAQAVPFTTICKDIQANDSSSISDDTVADYHNALQNMFVIEDIPAWNPNLRSRTAIRTSMTRHFVDPSIGTASLGIGPKELLADLESFGLFFENMAVRDLRIYADALDGNVYHYRDSKGNECDAIVHLRNGDYGLIEIKLGGETKINEGAANLIALSKKIDTTKMHVPSFMMVLTAVGSYAYRRKDGVLVVPIGCLKN